MSPFANHDPAPHAAHSRAARYAGVALLVACGFVVLLFDLGEKSFGSHEVFVAVSSREMLNTGDWLVPRFGGLPRLEKPPLGYWVVAATGRLCGGIDEATARLPAAISALALTILVGFWARHWYGSVAGWGAAAAQLTSLYVIIFARKAEVDMLLCLLTTSALFLIAGHETDEPRRRASLRWTAVYALLGLAWLAKFQYGPTMVLGPAVVFLLVERRNRSLTHLANPVGLALFAAAMLAWPILLLGRVPEALDVWRHETLGRAIGELGYQPFWFYLPRIAWMTLPWLPLAVAVMPRSWRCAWSRRDRGSRTAENRRQMAGGRRQQTEARTPHSRSRERFLWIWLGTVLAVVSVVADKHNNYVIAALPAFSLWAGRGFIGVASWLARPMRNPTRLEAFLWTGGLLAAAIVAPTLAIRHIPALLPTAWVFSGIIACGAGGAVWLLRFGRKVPASIVLASALLVYYTLVSAWELPHWDHRRSAVQFAARVRGDLREGEEIVVYRMGMSSLVYYLQDPVSRIETPETLADQLNRSKRMVVVTYDTAWTDLATAGEAREVYRSWADASLPAPNDGQLMFVELTSRGLPQEELSAVSFQRSANNDRVAPVVAR